MVFINEKLYVVVNSSGEGCRIIVLGDNGGAKNVAFLSGAPCNIQYPAWSS